VATTPIIFADAFIKNIDFFTEPKQYYCAAANKLLSLNSTSTALLVTNLLLRTCFIKVGVDQGPI
jgi:hypothetical protein